MYSLYDTSTHRMIIWHVSSLPTVHSDQLLSWWRSEWFWTQSHRSSEQWKGHCRVVVNLCLDDHTTCVHNLLCTVNKSQPISRLGEFIRWPIMSISADCCFSSSLLTHIAWQIDKSKSRQHGGMTTPRAHISTWAMNDKECVTPSLGTSI